MDSPELREVYNENAEKSPSYYAELGQNEALFAKFKAWKASPGYAALSARAPPPPPQKSVENELRDFRLGGAELPADKKARFMQVQKNGATLRQVRENILDATNDFALYVDDGHACGHAGRRAGDDESRRRGRRQDRRKITLHMPSYLPVMQYADNRDLREQLYRAYVTRASEFGKPDSTTLADQQHPQTAARGASCSISKATPKFRWRQDGRHPGRGAEVPRRARRPRAPLR